MMVDSFNFFRRHYFELKCLIFYDVSLFKTLKGNVEKVDWFMYEAEKTCIVYFSSILSE